MLERYNIVSLKNLQDAGAKLGAWSRQQKNRRTPSRCRGPEPKQIRSRCLHGRMKSTVPTRRKRRRNLVESGVRRRRFASLFASGRMEKGIGVRGEWLGRRGSKPDTQLPRE